VVTPALRELLGELDFPTDGRYPTPAEIADRMPTKPRKLNADIFFEGFAWKGVLVR